MVMDLMLSPAYALPLMSASIIAHGVAVREDQATAAAEGNDLSLLRVAYIERMAAAFPVPAQKPLFAIGRAARICSAVA